MQAEWHYQSIGAQFRRRRFILAARRRPLMKLRDILELLLLSAIWGASFLLISLTVQSFPPTWVALIRTGFGSAFLWTVLLARRRSLPPRRLLGWLL